MSRPTALTDAPTGAGSALGSEDRCVSSQTEALHLIVTNAGIVADRAGPVTATVTPWRGMPRALTPTSSGERR